MEVLNRGSLNLEKGEFYCRVVDAEVFFHLLGKKIARISDVAFASSKVFDVADVEDIPTFYQFVIDENLDGKRDILVKYCLEFDGGPTLRYSGGELWFITNDTYLLESFSLAVLKQYGYEPETIFRYLCKSESSMTLVRPDMAIIEEPVLNWIN